MENSTIFPSVAAVLLALALIAVQRTEGARWAMLSGCDAESVAACGCAGLVDVPGLGNPDFPRQLFLAVTGCPIEQR